MTEPAHGKPEPPMVEGKIALRVRQYIICRDKRRALKKQFEEADKPYSELEQMLSAAIMSHLNDIGAENVRTADGTCYKTTRSTASLADPDLFMKFVIENSMFDLLDRKANTTAVKEYVSEHGLLPPGANLSSIQTIGVHKRA